MRRLACVLLATGALAACGRAADGTPSPSGTGDASTSAAPQAGGSSGMKGTFPAPGSSGASAVLGASGKGTADPGGRSQNAQPGVGTAGGLGTGASGLGMTGSFPAADSTTQGAASGTATR